MGTEASVLDQAQVGFPCGDGSGAASHGLKIIVWNAADVRDGRQHGGGHAIAPGDVLGSPFGEEFFAGERQIAQVDRIEIVGSLLRADQLHAVGERSVEPQRVDIVFRNAEQQRNPVVGTYLGERSGRVPCRGYHQYLALVASVEAAAYRVGFGLLERTGLHAGPDFGVIAVERDVEMFQSEAFGQRPAFVRDRSARSFERAVHGQPVGETVDAVLFALGVETFGFVYGSDERRGLALAVVERPSLVVEETVRGDVPQLILRCVEILHSWVVALKNKSAPDFPKFRVTTKVDIFRRKSPSRSR